MGIWWYNFNDDLVNVALNPIDMEWRFLTSLLLKLWKPTSCDCSIRKTWGSWHKHAPNMWRMKHVVFVANETFGRRLTAVMSRRSLEVSGHKCGTLRFPGCHQVCPFGRWKWRLCLHVPWRSSMGIPIIHAGRLKWLVGMVHGIVFAIVCQLHQITVYPHYSIISIFWLMKLKFLGMNILDS